jgi:effector-binding domain-containing protein
LPDELSSWQLPATRALCVEHTGSYDNLGNAWSAAYQFARYKKSKQINSGTYEIYKNNPQDTSPAELWTEIFLPLKS